MELQIPQEPVEGLPDERLEATPDLDVVEHAAQAFDREGQVTRDGLLERPDQPERQHVLEGSVRDQEPLGRPVQVVLDGSTEVVALHRAAEPVLHG